MSVPCAIIFVLSITVQYVIANEYEFVEYTREAKTTYGRQCLTGCSPVDHECVVNWAWKKRSCVTNEPAPLYFSAKKKEPNSRFCLSKCGYFGAIREWCIVSKDLKWDYCSSMKRKTDGTTSQGRVEAQTIKGATCVNACNRTDSYYKCDTSRSWDYCAPPALSRIPVLPLDFAVGSMNKGKCDDFLGFRSNDPVFGYLHKVKAYASDNFISDYADGIEYTSGQNDTVSRVFKFTDVLGSIDRYTMVNIKEHYVPAIVRATVNKNTSSKPKVPISGAVLRKVREQMVNGGGYELKNIIPTENGGTHDLFNVVPMSFDAGHTWDELASALRRWTQETNGSVDILVVIFYHNEETPIPKAFGISLKFKNADGSLFVDCRDQIYWSQLMLR